jgi:ribokinase
MVRNGILVVGSANMDMVVMTRRFPQPGETVFGGKFGMFPGGKGANQAVAAAKLGGRVYFIGKMGNDIFREKLSASMKRDGVILDRMVVDPRQSTGIALITVNQAGQNEIVVVSGSNMKLTPDDVTRQRAVFGRIRVLLLQLEIPLPTVARAARLALERAVTVILNPAPARPLPRSLLKMVDFLTPNETELAQLSGLPVNGNRNAERAARVLLDIGVRNVMVTLGSRGCMLVNRQTTRIFPSFDVKAVDTTAAGDAFNGGFAHAIASGYSLEESIMMANAVAALSVTRVGAQSSMPTMKEVRSLLD